MSSGESGVAVDKIAGFKMFIASASVNLDETSTSNKRRTRVKPDALARNFAKADGETCDRLRIALMIALER